MRGFDRGSRCVRTPSECLALAARSIRIWSILDRSLLVVLASPTSLLSVFGSDVAHSPGYRQALIEASIVTNAALRPTRYSKSSSPTSRLKGAAASAFLFSRHARYGHHATATSNGAGLAADSPRSRGICSILATQWFNRNELLHISNSEHGLAEGMGLLIAGTIIEALHWQIWAENRDGAGACVAVQVPSCQIVGDPRHPYARADEVIE